MFASPILVLVALVAILAIWRVYLLRCRLLLLPHLHSYTTGARLSHLPYVTRVYLYEPFRTQCLNEAHKINNIIRLTPSHLSFSSPKAVEDIYGHSSGCVKGDLYEMTSGTHNHILNTPNKHEHRIKRKRLAAAFATKNLLNWESKVVDKVERFLTQMDIRCFSSPASTNNQMGRSPLTDDVAGYVDFRKWFNLFSIEAIADIASSQHLGLLESETDSVKALSAAGTLYETEFIEAVHGGARCSFPFVFADSMMYPWLKQLLALIFPTIRKEEINSDKFGDIIRWLVQQRQERGKTTANTKLDDFASCLINTQPETTEIKIDEGEILAEMSIFMDAGSDTTAIALTHVLWQLVQHPEKLRKLREELAPYFGTADGEPNIPSYKSLSQCVYLRACLNEALRLYPPLSAGLQRKPPPGGTMIGECFVPEHINVSVPAYVLHRNPEVFTEPDTFHPERWLVNNNAAEGLLTPSQYAFIPFSLGARGCIGRNITYIEQTLLIAVLVHNYDFSAPPAAWRMEWEERSNLWPKDLPLRFSRR